MPSPTLLDTLTWTTREDIAPRLLAYLQETRGSAAAEESQPGVNQIREQVAELLAHFATPQQQEALLAFVLDPEEDDEVRRTALRSLGELGAAVPWPALQGLLNEPDSYEYGEPRFELADILRLARTPDAVASAQEYLLTLEPTERMTVLSALLPEAEGSQHPLGEWLYQRWLEDDHRLLMEDGAPGHQNEWLAKGSRDRIETRRLLQEWWRRAHGEARGELLAYLSDERAEYALPGPFTPEEWQELTQALALPVSELIQRLGRNGVFHRLEEALTTELQQAEADRQARRLRKTEKTRERLGLLPHWYDPEVVRWLARQVMHTRSHHGLGWYLLSLLFFRDRRAAAATLAALLRAGDHDLPRVCLWWAAGNPVPDDEEFLREAFWLEQSQEYRYYGLAGLDRLPAAGQDWVADLPTIAEDERLDIRLRLRAWGALARRGDEAALTILRTCATEEPDLRVRATALDILAEVAPGPAWPLLVEAVGFTGPEHDLCEQGFDASPLAEEAALALAQIPTPEARTLLLRAFLHARTRGLMVVTNDCFWRILDTSDGEQILRFSPGISWRQGIRWRWPS